MKPTGGRRKLNNTGSAIVTVLVVVTFLTILATVMLYVSGANYQMKTTDYRTKESFYQAETPVEELRAQLVKDAVDAFTEAYTAAISEYSGMGDANTREANYRQLFCEAMNEIWESRCGLKPDSSNLDWEAGIGKVVQSAPAGANWYVEVTPAGELDSSRAISEGLLILKGVTFTYDSPNHFTSIISTDYCITIPRVNWSDEFEEEAAAGSQLDFSGCVNYMNWTKQ